MPAQSQLVFPLLELAHDSGGTVSSGVAYDELARRHGLCDDVREHVVRLECGQKHNLWERHVRFAKERAKQAGYLFSERHGEWRLTDEGAEAVKSARSLVIVTVVRGANNAPVGAQIQLGMAIPTVHSLHLGDARDMSWISDEQIPLVVTSVPYFDLKEYEHAPGQLSDITSYDGFVDALSEVMRECYRVLMPGGRIAVNVGDVLRSRGKHGMHEVLPLSADLRVNCRKIGFSALTGIIWQKLSNCRYEQGGSGILGQPGMPRMVIKSECEDILLFKKRGPNFNATPAQRAASRISKEEWQKWVRGLWTDLPGARASSNHPAPYPIELPYRLIRMLSYSGPEPHTVLDPFAGEFNTAKAAMKASRNSISIEIGPGYFSRGLESLRQEANVLVTA